MQALASFFGFNWGTTAPAVEKRRTRRTIIPVTLKPGGLSRFGYSVENSVRSRHIALLRAAREEGYAPIIQRLNITATFLKNSSPKKSRVFKMDQRWLSDYYAAVKERDGHKSRSSMRTGGSSKLTAGASSPSRGRLSAPVYDADNDDSYEEDVEYDMSLSQSMGSDDDSDSDSDTDYDEDD